MSLTCVTGVGGHGDLCPNCATYPRNLLHNVLYLGKPISRHLGANVQTPRAEINPGPPASTCRPKIRAISWAAENDLRLEKGFSLVQGGGVLASTTFKDTASIVSFT